MNSPHELTPINEALRTRILALKAKDRVILINQIASSGNVQFKTPVSESLMLDLVDWLNSAANGGMVLGWFRMGKTCGCRWALKSLSKFLEFNVAYIEIPKRSDDERNKRVLSSEFFDYLIHCTGHAHQELRGHVKKRNQLSDYFSQLAKSSPLRTMILYFDEGAELTPDELKWIRDIGNEMDKAGMRLFVLISGTDAILDARAELIKIGEEQLVARYLGKRFGYRGLTSVEEAATCVSNFLALESRPGSGLSANALFKVLGDVVIDPGALGKGLWDAFAYAWTEAGLGNDVELPMKYFCEAIAWLFNESNKIGWSAAPSQTAIEAAVENSTFDVAIEIRIAKKQAGSLPVPPPPAATNTESAPTPSEATA